MPQLPTLDVTQAQADRLLAAFGNAHEYRLWLRRQLVDFVLRYERSAVDSEVEDLRRQRLEQIGSEVLPEVTP